MSMKREIAKLKRQRILETAASQFSKRGYYNTTLDDIASELGMTKTFIYSVFRNKSELLAASFLQVVDLCLDAAEAAAKGKEPAGERLRKLVERIVHISAENLPFSAIQLREEKSLDPEALAAVQQREDRFYVLFTQLLEEGSASGEFSIPDVRITALAIGGMIGWLYGGRNTISSEETDTVASVISAIVSQMVGVGIAPR